jgi:hypothetical protein
MCKVGTTISEALLEGQINKDTTAVGDPPH